MVVLQKALHDRHDLQEKNYQLQHKLADYFRKKKSDEVRQDANKNVSDQEQRYLKYMGERNYNIIITCIVASGTGCWSRLFGVCQTTRCAMQVRSFISLTIEI